MINPSAFETASFFFWDTGLRDWLNHGLFEADDPTNFWAWPSYNKCLPFSSMASCLCIFFMIADSPPYNVLETTHPLL